MRANQRFLIGLGAALLLAVGACETEGKIPPVEQTTFERLQARTVLTFDTDATTVGLVGRVNRGDTWETGKAKLPLRRGYVSVSADPDGEVVVDQFELWLEDVILTEAEYPPRGLHLTNLIVRMDQEAVGEHTVWSTDDEAFTAELKLALTFDWAIVVDDRAIQLGTQRLGVVDADTTVYRRANGDLVVEMAIRSDGTVWDWAGLIEFTDLTINVLGIDEPWVL